VKALLIIQFRTIILYLLLCTACVNSEDRKADYELAKSGNHQSFQSERV
jgi:hypothetical protein